MRKSKFVVQRVVNLTPGSSSKRFKTMYDQERIASAPMVYGVKKSITYGIRKWNAPIEVAGRDYIYTGGKLTDIVDLTR